MRKLWVLIFLVTLSASAQAEATARKDWVSYLFKCTGKTCTINENGGGLLWTFELAAKQALARKLKVRINGKCSSGCVVFASRVWKYACVTPNAKMGVHKGRYVQLFDPAGVQLDLGIESNVEKYMSPPQGYRVVGLGYFDVDYGKDINVWAKKHNKMPASTDVYVMTHEEALQFWRPCL